MQKLVWQNANGETIDLTSGSYGITEWEGFSNASLNIQSQQVPFQDGAVFLDALIEPRELSVTLAIQDNNNLELRYQLRRELIHKLNPKLGEGYLIYTNDFISKRIKCVAQIPLFETHNSNDSGTPKASLSWTACEPYWEDLEENEINFDITQQPIIKNDGDIPTQIKMDWITSNIQNPSVTNITTGKRIKYKGDLTDSLEINTNVGNKSVVSKKMGWKISSILVEYNAVTYSEDLNIICCVCDGGIILTSSDGVNWEISSSISVTYLLGVYYSEVKKLFIAVGSEGIILTSVDAKNWTQRTSGVSTYLYSVAYSESLDMFVVTGSNGTILTSSDGINWISRTSGVSANLSSVIYAKGKYIVSGTLYNSQTQITTAYILISTNGVDWTTLSSSTSELFNNIIYSETLDLFVSSNGNAIRTSPDCITWSTQLSGANGNFNNIIYNNTLGVFIAVGTNGIIYTSPNGTNWILRNSNTTSTLRNTVYATNIGLFVIVGYYSSGIPLQTVNSVILTSVDSVNWTKYINDVRTPNNGIAYSEKLKKYVITKSGDPNVYISNDGINWESNEQLLQAGFGGVIYVEDFNSFFTFKNSIRKSTDGINWVPTSRNGNGLAYLKATRKMWLSSSSGDWYYTTDGVNWTRKIGSSPNANGICASEKLQMLVAVGNSGNIYTNNGYEDTWSQVTSGTSTTLNSVIYSETLGVFVAVGNNGVILTSNDGTNWTSRNSGVSVQLNQVIYSEAFGIFVVVGNGGVILTSSDGINWYQKSTNITNNLYGVCASLDKIIIVGAMNLILYSQLEVAENQIQFITADSDIGLNLAIGDNKMMMGKTAGNMVVRIKYRQKYIGV